MEEDWRERRTLIDWRDGLTSDELDSRIEAWHNAPSDSHLASMPLHEYLGWSWEQYKRWVENGDIPNASN